MNAEEGKADPVERCLVSIVTPVYNGEPYLAECIESVLAQTYKNFEYVIIDNCSTDNSLETARSYANRDGRIRICQNEAFLSQMDNHNRALRSISAESTYCKMVAADDFIFPGCVEQMVTLAERNPKIGVVGAYTLLDWGNYSSVYLTGLPYRQNVFPGRDVCRRFLNEGLYVFGSPTATLIRSEIVRNRDPFYYEDSITADVDIFFEILDSWDFGFVHEILTYTRRHNISTISSRSSFGLMMLTELVEIVRYGRDFLDEKEYVSRLRHIQNAHRRLLGEGFLRCKPRDFWDIHKRGMRFAGRPISTGWVVSGVIAALLDLLLNPKSTLERVISAAGRKRA
jgi:glycosyltransferase involved in cell wall biosynthesis